MTTTPKVEPASESDIARWKSVLAHQKCKEPGRCDWCRLIARIESDRARIREQTEEIAVFKQSIAGTYPVNAMCCDGHERILFYSDFETCPLCAALSKPEPGR